MPNQYCNEGAHWVDQLDIDLASGWCKKHAPQNALKKVIVCSSCGRMKVSDWGHLSICSVCREKAAGRTRHRCPLCDGRKKARAVICCDCAVYLPVLQRYTAMSATVGARQGWTRTKRKRWAMAKTREQMKGAVWAGSSADLQH